MADAVKVDTQGLHSHAEVCVAVATSLGGSHPVPSAGSLHQATTAAVLHGNTLIRAVAAAMSGRATSTGTTLRTAAGTYTSTDSGSAQRITSVQV